MAKEGKRSPVALFMTAGLLMTGGWLMTSFPVFIFFAMVPLFALTDRVDNSPFVWEKMEWVLLSLVVFFLAGRVFDFSFIVSSLVYAILFTFPFVGYVWVRSILGKRVGKITIVIFWLTIEYILLKCRPEESLFLADSLRLQPDWVRWNIHTGYLGASCWILMTNLMIYQTLFAENPFQWYWILIAVVCLVGPAVYSHFLDFTSLSRYDMINLYKGKSMIGDVTYLAQGEFVVRTTAWLSTLTLLFTLVKRQTANR